MAYAEYTKVPVDQTRLEIERTLTKYGADRFAYFTETGHAIIVFEANQRRIKFDLPLPDKVADKTGSHTRQKWRALLLCIKAKLEAVDSKIESFEEAFLAHVVMPDGKTVAEHTAERIEQSYSSGTMMPLLPAPGR
jgi:hypothetical protein